MSTKPGSYRIVALTAENIKRLTAVHIEPDGNLVQITGRNRQGKTSVLDSIWWAFESAKHIQVSPIRRGAKKALIRVNLGELIVTRTFAAKEDGGYTTRLTVETKDGAVFKSPQGVLEELIGELSFDPLSFARMKPREQFDQLKSFVTEVDIDKLDAQHDGHFEKRTDVNRDLERARAALAMTEVAEEPPATRVDTNALITKLQESGDENALTERRSANRQNVADRITSLRSTAAAKAAEIVSETIEIEQKLAADRADLQQQIEALQRRLTRLDADAVEKTHQVREELNRESEVALRDAGQLQAQLDGAEPLPEIIDTVALAEELNAANASNKLLDEWELASVRRRDLQSEVDRLAVQSDDLTIKITECKTKKADAIAKAKLPVDGLGFGDGFITLAGEPFEQASDAEQLEASVSIAAQLNPRLRVIRIREGARLDDFAMERLEQFAQQHDFQIWIERVDSSGNVGFVLEDGHLKLVASQEDAA